MRVDGEPPGIAEIVLLQVDFRALHGVVCAIRLRLCLGYTS